MSPGAKSSDECVKVVVRCRPMNNKEINEQRQRIVEMDLTLGQVSLRNPKLDAREPPKNFTFDQVYNWDAKQIDIFNISAKPIVESVIGGYNGTMFAYGQTGTGAASGTLGPVTDELCAAGRGCLPGLPLSPSA